MAVPLRRLAVAAALALTLPAASPAEEPAPAARPEAAAAAVAAVGPVTSLPLPRYVSLRGSEANARRGPSVNQRVDWTFLRRGLPLQITAEYGNWRRVRDSEGAGGWVHYMLLSGVRTALVQGEGPLPLRAEASEAAQIRAFAEPGVIARVEHCPSAWCELQVEGIKGWAPRDVLWGLGPDEVIE